MSPQPVTPPACLAGRAGAVGELPVEEEHDLQLLPCRGRYEGARAKKKDEEDYVDDEEREEKGVSPVPSLTAAISVPGHEHSAHKVSQAPQHQSVTPLHALAVATFTGHLRIFQSIRYVSQF